MAADGSIIIDTKVNTDGFNALGGKLPGLTSMLKKIGGAIGVAFSLNAIKNFAKEAIDLGSDLSEVQNVVDVTFKTMSGAVNEYAKNALYTAGLSETMAKQYVGTFGAMANAFGFAEEDSFALSTALTTLSGDVASFYNITQDEAFTKLKSVFTGETESLKELGVVMTQTALDAFALERGFGRTTAQMSEQEKVALRYQFVMDRLSTASGDFARTSGGWANQTRMLSVQFDQLKATIGQGLINALTPVIQVINTIIGGLQTVANAFKQFTALLFGDATGASAGGATAQGMENIADGYGAAADSAEDMAKETKAAAKEAKKALAPFDELYKLTDESSGGGGGVGDAGTGGVGGLGNLGTFTADAAITDNISPKIEALVNKVKSLIAPLREIDFSPAVAAFTSFGESLSGIGTIITDVLEWAWFEILVPLSKWTIEDAAPATLNALSEAFELASAWLEPLWSGLEYLWDKMDPIFSWIGDTAVFIIEKFGEAFNILTEVIQERGPEIEGIIAGIADIVEVVWYTIEPYLSMARDVVGDVFLDIYEIIAIAIDAVLGVLSGLVDFIAGVLTADWSRAMEGLLEILSSVWDGIISIFEWIYAGIEDYIGGIVDAISAFVSDALGFLGGLFGQGTPSDTGGYSGISAYSVTPDVPYLAKGAVLPANKPFLAMVGDQSHGTNVEAPLDTIKQALAEVLAQTDGGDIQITFNGDLAALGRVLAPVVTRAQRNAERGGGK